MRTKNFFLLAMVFITIILLTDCNNPRASEPGKWYLPWTWGDKTLQQSLEEGCQGGALTTNIEGSTYPCPGYIPQQPAAPTPTVAPTTMPFQPATLTPATVPTPTPTLISDKVQTIYTAEGALPYPVLVEPDPSRQTVFPDVPFGSRPVLVSYEVPFEDGDYLEAGHGDIDLPQYYYRVMTAGTIRIDQLEVNCVATPTKGCAVILINHFGVTAMFRDAIVDNGFTVAGRIWDMSSPDKVTLAAQALLDHYTFRMTGTEDGANCGVVTACEAVEWHVVVVGNGDVQVHWTGIFHR